MAIATPAATTVAATRGTIDSSSTTRVSVRSVRRHAMDRLNKIQKDGEAGEDDVRRAEKDLEGTTHTYVAQIDELLKSKENELLEV